MSAGQDCGVSSECLGTDGSGYVFPQEDDLGLDAQHQNGHNFYALYTLGTDGYSISDRFIESQVAPATNSCLCRACHIPVA